MRLERVRGHDGGLHAEDAGTRPRRRRRPRARRAAPSSRAIARWNARVQEGRLDDLREPGPVRAIRQRPEDRRVRDDEARRVKGAGEVLPRGQVDGGLSAERAVGGREERRRRLDDGHAAQRERGREPADVAYGPAAERDDAAVAAQAAADQLLEEPAEDGPGLGGSRRPGRRGVLCSRTPSAPPADSRWPCRRKIFLEEMRNQRPGAMEGRRAPSVASAPGPTTTSVRAPAAENEKDRRPRILLFTF